MESPPDIKNLGPWTERPYDIRVERSRYEEHRRKKKTLKVSQAHGVTTGHAHVCACACDCMYKCIGVCTCVCM